MRSRKNSDVNDWHVGRQQSERDFKMSTVIVGCHCAAFMAYARSCARLGAAPAVQWKNITGCERKDSSVVQHELQMDRYRQ